MTFYDDQRIRQAARMIRGLDPAVVNWNGLARRFGLKREYLQRRLRPGYAEADNLRREGRLAAASKAMKPLRASSLNHVAREAAMRDLVSRLVEVPEDTRSLTARVLGDPLPGRSALERRT